MGFNLGKTVSKGIGGLTNILTGGEMHKKINDTGTTISLNFSCPPHMLRHGDGKI